uniref:Uncharacterized protein n=1 Tax=Musca domestica TaxID=7370 RepID=A0A1I8M9U8_MUSDO
MHKDIVPFPPCEISSTSVPDPCLAQRRCSTTEEIVYAVDTQQCYLFRNLCLYENDYCQRREKKEEELKIVSKEACLAKCRDFCTEEYFPLCAEHNGTFETFTNKCELHRNSCQKNKSYIFNHYGACEA